MSSPLTRLIVLTAELKDLPSELREMKAVGNHVFSESVKFQSACQVTSLKCGDGVAREMLTITGEYKGREGSLEFIKDADDALSHRPFKPEKEL
jgi:hypothetical protein